MSVTFARFRILAMLAVFSMGVVVAGCTTDKTEADIKRSQQQSAELQNRINTTQIDR